MYAPAPAQYFPVGLGDMQSAQQGVALGAAGASSGAAIAAAAGLIPAAAVPFIGPAIAGAALLISYLVKQSGCGQTCIQTSSWANQVGQALSDNLHAYLDQPVRTRSSQQVALANFDSAWARLKELCGDPQWGDAGKRCISDRQAGACVWKGADGQCWNWFSGFRDPIANDPNVVPDPTVSEQAGNLLTAAGEYTGDVLVSAGVPSNYVVPILFGAAVLAVWVAVKQ